MANGAVERVGISEQGKLIKVERIETAVVASVWECGASADENKLQRRKLGRLT